MGSYHTCPIELVPPVLLYEKINQFADNRTCKLLKRYRYFFMLMRNKMELMVSIELFSNSRWSRTKSKTCTILIFEILILTLLIKYIHVSIINNIHIRSKSRIKGKLSLMMKNCNSWPDNAEKFCFSCKNKRCTQD